MAEAGIDTREIDKMLKDLKSGLADGAVRGVKAGWLTSTEYKQTQKDMDDGKVPTKIADVALWNNFGTERIPARPFLNDAQRHAGPVMENRLKTYMEAGFTLDRIAKLLKLDLGEILKSEIEYGTFEPNAKSTIRAKGGSTHPLIDTGQLINSIHATVIRAHGEDTPIKITKD